MSAELHWPSLVAMAALADPDTKILKCAMALPGGSFTDHEGRELYVLLVVAEAPRPVTP